MPISQIIKPSYELLGSINAISGASQVLSGLDLTLYEKLFIVVKSLNTSLSASLSVEGLTVTPLSAGNGLHAFVDVDLGSGQFVASARSGGTKAVSAGSSLYQGFADLRNTGTQVTFALNTGTFVSGTIEVFGVK